MIKADLVSGTFLLIAAIVATFVIIPDQIDASNTDGMSPDLLPLILVSATGLFSLMLIVSRLFSAADGQPSPISRHDVRATMVIAAFVAGAIFLMQIIGLIASGAVLIAALSWIMGERRPVVLAAISLIPVGAISVLASAVLRIALP